MSCKMPLLNQGLLLLATVAPVLTPDRNARYRVWFKGSVRLLWPLP
jgi:hypothetical protein